MPKTRADLAARTLEKLLVVGTGQSPEDEDVEKVKNTIDAVFETLSTDGTYTVADPEDIDLSAFEWLAVVVAFYNATDFGKAPDANALEYAEKRLRKLLSSGPSGEVLKAEYF